MDSHPLDPIPSFQLLQWKYALRLEQKGLKHSRGSVAARVRKTLSVSRQYPIDKLITIVTDALDERVREKSYAQI